MDEGSSLVSDIYYINIWSVERDRLHVVVWVR